jgi:hypothetical protein
VVVVPSQYLQVHVTRGITQHVACGIHAAAAGLAFPLCYKVVPGLKELIGPAATGRLGSVRIVCAAAVDV